MSKYFGNETNIKLIHCNLTLYSSFKGTILEFLLTQFLDQKISFEENVLEELFLADVLLMGTLNISGGTRGLLLFLYFQLTIYKVVYIYTVKIAQYWLI